MCFYLSPSQEMVSAHEKGSVDNGGNAESSNEPQ